MFLAGLTATVEAVFLDVDGDRHLAVTVDDDPAAELTGSNAQIVDALKVGCPGYAVMRSLMMVLRGTEFGSSSELVLAPRCM